MDGEKEPGEPLSGSYLEALNERIIHSLAYIIDAKDRYTSGHSWRVAEYSRELARRLGKSEAEQKLVYQAGLLHDIGKIRVEEEVINKPTSLTDEEFDLMKVHPLSGYFMLKDIYKDRYIPQGARYHHEKYDGTGYPIGLAGDEIPEIARIIAVADAYDAMASTRSYREALPQAVVRAEIEKGRGKQFDPVVVTAMLTMIDEDTKYRLRQFPEAQKRILLIDGEKLTHQTCDIILEDTPYDLLGAESFPAALAILAEKPVDLVLLDMAAPGMDSGEAVKQIKGRCNAPLVFVLADKSRETINKAFALGAEDYVTKPLQPMFLLETVHGILDKGRK